MRGSSRKGTKVSEQEREIVNTTLAAIMGGLSQSVRDSLYQATYKTEDTLREMFAGEPDETVAKASEVIAMIVGQIMTVPAIELSDTLEHTSALYLVAAAHLRGIYDLPEREGTPKPMDGAPAHVPAATTTVTASPDKFAGPYL